MLVEDDELEPDDDVDVLFCCDAGLEFKLFGDEDKSGDSDGDAMAVFEFCIK